MKIFHFDAGEGRKIDAFGSTSFTQMPILQIPSRARVSRIHLGQDGRIGLHPTNSDQLLIIIQGEGWVRAGSSEQAPISMGMAVLWEKGEMHETGTGTELEALVIEGDRLELSDSLHPMDS